MKEEVAVGDAYVAGESNGGFMAQRLAQERPDAFAAVGVVISAMPADNACTQAEAPSSLAYVVGTADVTVPWEGGRAALAASGTMLSSDASLAHWRDHDGCDPEPGVETLPDLDSGDGTTVEKHTWTCPGGIGLVRYRVDGGGHVVPSIEEPVTAAWEALVGAQSHDIETATELWRFFQTH